MSKGKIVTLFKSAAQNESKSSNVVFKSILHNLPSMLQGLYCLSPFLNCRRKRKLIIFYLFFQLLYGRFENHRAFRDVHHGADGQVEPDPDAARGREARSLGGPQQPQKLAWLQQDGKLRARVRPPPRRRKFFYRYRY